jgi:hypothetical protein
MVPGFSFRFWRFAFTFLCICILKLILKLHLFSSLHSFTSFVKCHSHYYFAIWLILSISANGDFDSWISSSKPTTVKQYVDWITDYANYYCRHDGLNNIHDEWWAVFYLWYLLFLFYRHETPKIVKRSNKRQKVSKGEDIHLTEEDERVVVQYFIGS